MKNKKIVFPVAAVIVAIAIYFILWAPGLTGINEADVPRAGANTRQRIEPDGLAPSNRAQSGHAAPNGSELTQTQIEQALSDIDNRSGSDQTDPALNDLNALVTRYDEMSHEEKRELLTDYATHFLRNRQYEDARYFYEQVLQLPGLEHTNRLAVLQMLARIAMAAEDWQGFLAYNDQYFDEGGGYNWIVTGHLMRAFQPLENYDAAGEALLIHFETGLFPQYDGSNEQYERLYGSIDSIPLDMSDHQSAVLIAEKLAEQFDRPENWRVLSEVYRLAGNTAQYNQAVNTAREKGFVDNNGNWIAGP
jgi:hypothetical protein